MIKALLSLFAIVLVVSSCKKEATTVDNPINDSSKYNLVFKFKFDSTQARLNNIGQEAPITPGNAGQSPVFNAMSAHYIELAPGGLTQLGKGVVLYRAEEVTTGGANAINFEKAKLAGNGEVFFSIPLKNVTAGSYNWLRVSLAYQNYDIKYNVDTTISGFHINQVNEGTVSSFLGFNSYIKSYNIKTKTMVVNDNRKQGYWGFESSYTLPVIGARTDTASGQSASTTVVNPLASTSPIPPGSCVVTAQFAPGTLTITGKETKDIIIEVSLSTKKSFEWKEVVNNGMWDPIKGEQIVDMGIRGMIPSIK